MSLPPAVLAALACHPADSWSACAHGASAAWRPDPFREPEEAAGGLVLTGHSDLPATGVPERRWRAWLGVAALTGLVVGGGLAWQREAEVAGWGFVGAVIGLLVGLLALAVDGVRRAARGRPGPVALVASRGGLAVEAGSARASQPWAPSAVLLVEPVALEDEVLELFAPVRREVAVLADGVRTVLVDEEVPAAYRRRGRAFEHLHRLSEPAGPVEPPLEDDSMARLAGRLAAVLGVPALRREVHLSVDREGDFELKVEVRPDQPL